MAPALCTGVISFPLHSGCSSSQPSVGASLRQSSFGIVLGYPWPCVPPTLALDLFLSAVALFCSRERQ